MKFFVVKLRTEIFLCLFDDQNHILTDIELRITDDVMIMNNFM